MSPGRLALLAGLGLTIAAVGGKPVSRDDTFDHWKHRKLFPSCETCHAGALEAGAPLFPAEVSCTACHNGNVLVAGKALEEVQWRSPSAKRVSNLRFTHPDHIREVADRRGTDSSVACLQCHGEKNAQWMQVAEQPVQQSCMTCHGITVAHYSAPDSACATCHVTLAEARDLTRERIARFPEPDSHQAPGFLLSKGHGVQAQAAKGSKRHYEVAQSCATCHAREFCTQCHVNAPEVRLIQALASDPRSLAIPAKLEEPKDHTDERFLSRHGAQSRKPEANCVNCHTQQNCISCHRAAPGVAVALHAASPDRGPGPSIERKRPATHIADFADRHADLASATPRSCTACHARSECLDCHRPNAGNADSYHPAGFLSRHPSAAYNRQSDCSECHNQASFCTTCHSQAGFRSTNGILTGKFHDTKGSFLLGHGQAARQNIESCVTCHTETDCLACHSAQTRGFNPHGPGFDAERLRKKNPQTCAACHGRAIPGR